MGVLEALRHPKVLLLALAYFLAVTGNYGVEFFLPTILQQWNGLSLNDVTTWILIPNLALLLGQVLVGWSSDRAPRALAARLVAGLLRGAGAGLRPLRRRATWRSRC